MDAGTATQEQLEDAAGGLDSFANMGKHGGDDYGYQPLNNEEEFPVHSNYVNNPYDPREER
jgi:hypothetical protein